jgi:FKBP-type peptidyl-prolyl cis-trans isomerase
VGQLKPGWKLCVQEMMKLKAACAARWIALWAIVLLTGAAHSSERPERRVALVVGNAAYEGAPLGNPVNDARDLSAALRRLGFEVLERLNRNSDELRRDLAEFQDKLSPGAIGLFYFAGHGVQAGRGLNYLLPVGIEYRRERDAELYGLEAGAVLRRMEEAQAGLSLLILDACRDSPLPPEARSSISRGLSRMEAPSGSLVAFATAPGSTADENRDGRNGLYTYHLLQHIEVPGLRLEDVFKRVRAGVEAASNRRQSPEEISKLTTDFYFLPGSQVAGSMARDAASPAQRPPQGGPVALSDLEAAQRNRGEWAQWQSSMRADFDRVLAFSGTPDLRRQAWERFLEAWRANNPHTLEDEDLRRRASELKEQAARLAGSSQPSQLTAGVSAAPPATSDAGRLPAQPVGLVYRELIRGDGASPLAEDTVRIHYVGTFPDGREFDSSIRRGQPAQFPLNRVIKCWTEALQKMRVGGRASLTCPPELAYGQRGTPGGPIPPNATLNFEVELLGVVRR